jgi:hypothetical protein
VVVDGRGGPSSGGSEGEGEGGGRREEINKAQAKLSGA